MKRTILILSFLFILFFLIPQQGTASNDRERRIGVHDPVMIRQDSTYYLFHTGRGIGVWSSTDMKNWKREKPVFETAPQWAVDAIPTFRGHIWAPDISYYNGQYYLYYSVSAFGKNSSCIGLATNKTLHPNDPDYKWVDHGAVICSTPGKDNWNAIDPNLIIDDEGRAFLIYGSFWDGLQMVRLSDDLTAPYPGEEPVTIASRKHSRSPENPPAIDNNPVDAGGNAIEAPFVVRRGDYYYLFASIDYCCKGVESTYKMIYGRADRIEGPYLDKEGKELLFGGGTILMEGDERWHGVGHNAIASSCGKDFLLFHAYDASDEGRSKLRIIRLSWTEEQWPQLLEEIY
jgi:arabinan endo-1,5-alpha-L-arabinosidase